MRRLIPTTALLMVCTLSAMAQTLSDDFNDGVFNPAVWATDTAISVQLFNVRPDLVTIDESSGQLVFSENGLQVYGGTNAYVTNAVYDLRGRRISAKLSAAGGLDVWIAAGTDRFNMIQAPVSYTHLTLPTILRV